jgi:two-component system, chemotaxis family, chemotaxis protein CheY
MKRILIVDDAATVRMYYRTILEEAGYLVVEAVNGIEALEKALEEPFDLYIADINMPKLDGYGFMKELRSMELPQVPAMMVSTEASANDKLRAYTAGANLYLVKPIKPDLLLRNCHLLLGEGCP